ncbi:MAG: peptidoglycan DD-metalloendopeptidase family protein [Chitinophagales bacterium]|nr:peptidoglycan DD-metalloendopeptidase family protein [Chitinophagales bacterium]
MKRIITYLFLVSVFPVMVFAQDQKTLEKKRESLEKEIKQTEAAIQEIRKNKNVSRKELINLEQQIKLRQQLINNTQKEIKTYNSQINDANNSLQKLKDELATLREDYGKAIYGTYKSYKMADQLLFVANASSFSDAMRRLNYLRKIGDYRKYQVDEIGRTQVEISHHITEIEVKKKKQEQLLADQKNQESEMQKNKLEKSQLAEQLSKQEGKLSKELALKKKESQRLNAQIQAIIAQEIARQKKLEEERRRKEAEEAKKLEQQGKKPAQQPTQVQPATPEVAMLSASFVSNKGKLPWPVSNGSISRRFGRYVHPEFGTELENKGLDFSTSKGAGVRAIFKGTVLSIISNPVYKNAVIISHGDYFTVYTKLQSVSVSKGQTVSERQTIGTAFTNPDNNQTEMHLEIWNKNIAVNPSLWLAK